MSKRRFRMVNGKLVEVFRRPPRPRIHVISDYHDPFQSMADGKTYDSKSEYRAALKAEGCHELGNDRPDRATIDEGDIAQDIQDVLDGRVDVQDGVEAPAGFDRSVL